MVTVVYSESYQDQAATRIRIIEPLEFLAQTDHFNCLSLESIIGKHQKNGTFPVDNPDFRRADVLYLFITDINHTNFTQVGPVIDYFLKAGKAVVSNLDDHYFKVPGSITVKKEMEKNAPLFKQLITVSRLVLVTGKVLKDEISPINPNILVVPNMIDPLKFQIRKGGNEKIRIGWCGLPSHFADLAMVIPAVKRIMEIYPVEFTLFGLFNEDMKKTVTEARELGMSIEEIEKHFPEQHFIGDALNMANQLEGVPYRHVPLVTYAEFPQMLSELNFDIGLCPLQDTLFNRCKSAIKLAQYSAVGTVTVAGNVYPYNEECNYLAENTTEDWYRKIAQLVENNELRDSVLEEQRSYILNNRNYHKGISLYEAIFKKVANPTG
ncbi:MAG: glycosyltransferase family 4 protein [bacterium]|nr:glycosyltransferase family 4 protein [bacterium]